MYILNSLEVKRWFLYKEGRFDFKPGVSLVGGKNAAGKSLMFAAIPTMFSLIHDKDDFEKAPKGSSLTLDYHKDETHVLYNLSTLSSTKYNIGVGNIDMHPHKQKDAKRVLRENWTIPHALFKTTVFLRGKEEHPLSTGTSGSRSTWLQDALDLTALYDAYKDEIDSKIQELGQKAHKISILMEEREKIASRIPESKIGKKSYDKASKRVRKYSKIMTELPSERQELANTLGIVEKIIDLPELDQPLSYYEDKLDKYRMERAKLQKIASSLEAIQEDLDYNLSISKKMKAIWSKYEGSPDQKKLKSWPFKGVKRAKKKYEEQAEATKQFVTQKKAYDAQEDWRKEVEELAKIMMWGHVSKNSKEALENQSNAKVELKEIRRKLENFEKIDGRKDCPTCGNALTKEHLKKEVKTLKARSKELSESLNKLESEVTYWELMKEERVKKPEKPTFSYKEHVALGDLIADHEEYQSLKGKLRKVEDVPSRDIDKDLSSLSKKVKRYDALRTASVNQAALHGMLPEKEMESWDRDRLRKWSQLAEARIAEIKAEVAHASQVTDKYQSIMIEFETQRKLVSQHRDTLHRLDEEIAELQKEVKDLEAYKALATAFGNSGVRLFQLRESAAVLSQKLTELSSLFFDSTYHFNIEVAPHKLNVTVERNGMVGSLKTLSGAETRCWNLLCAMALLRILPSHQRCDTMILDEIEANMDETSRNRYVKDVLPELTELVPKIVVITPLVNGELAIKPDYDYRAIKTRVNGEYHSKLISV